MVRSRPKRTARRGANGASSPISSTGKAVVRLITLRLRLSSSAMRSINGANEVMPGRRLMAASTRASMSSQRDGFFTVNPEADWEGSATLLPPLDQGKQNGPAGQVLLLLRFFSANSAISS